MRKLVAVVIMCAVIAGCGPQPTGEVYRSGNVNIYTVCVDGVKYIFWNEPQAGFASVKLDREGNVEHCEI